jgi:hypothetical protein
MQSKGQTATPSVSDALRVEVCKVKHVLWRHPFCCFHSAGAVTVHSSASRCTVTGLGSWPHSVCVEVRCVVWKQVSSIFTEAHHCTISWTNLVRSKHPRTMAWTLSANMALRLVPKEPTYHKVSQLKFRMHLSYLCACYMSGDSPSSVY